MRYFSFRGPAALACFLTLTGIAAGQTPPTPQAAPPADAASVDAIVKALYDGVSHAPGKE